MTEHEQKVRQLKLRMLEVAYKNQQGYLASSFSVLDILVSLYYEVMQNDLNQKGHIDEFVLSKGHAALALYSILEDKRIIEYAQLDRWAEYKSGICLMAERNVPGVLFTTGSLGHGFPEAVGLAYAKKIQNEKGTVFVLVGDGELDEGSNWEAVRAALRMKLNNLVCIIDNNFSSSFAGETNRLKEKFEAFNCLVEDVDGHNEHELSKTLKRSNDTVMIVVANTVKGKGCSVMEANPALWHAKAPNEQEYVEMVKEIL